MKMLLLLLAVGSLWYGQSAYFVRRAESAPVRLGLLSASLIVTSLVWILTETLSYASLLTATSLGRAWLIIAAGSTVWAVYQRVPTNRFTLLRWSTLSGSERFWLSAPAAIGVLTLVTALVYPPNNNDSLTYHMGRIGHWIQHHSVQPFATHIERQLYQPPLSEWIIMHTVLLSGTDLFANALQWMAGISCCVALSLLARMLGANRSVQLATVFVAATIPMVILQSSSTQNDVIVSYYLIVLAIYLLRYYQTRSFSNLVWAGMALGFAYLTKGTAYLLAAPLLLTWGLSELIRLPRRRWVRAAIPVAGAGLFVLSLALTINAGHYNRNLLVYGHPLTNADEQSFYTNEMHSVGMMISNISRNLALHFGFPGLHWVAEHSVKRLHDWLGISVIDRRITFFNTDFDLPMLSNNEDNASNLLHLIWLFGTVIWLIRTRKRAEHRPYLILASVTAVTFLLFCAYLKWQPWHSRLHTTLFLLSSPISAYGLVRVSQQGIRWPNWLMVASAFCFALLNPFRPLITLPPLTRPVSFLNGRLDNYYVNRQELLPFHRSVVAFVNQQKQDSLRVGLIMGEDDWDYVWFRELAPSVRVHHLNVKSSSRIADTTPAVDYIISTRTWGDTLVYRGQTYQRIPLKPDRISFLMPSLFEPKLVSNKVR